MSNSLTIKIVRDLLILSENGNAARYVAAGRTHCITGVSSISLGLARHSYFTPANPQGLCSSVYHSGGKEKRRGGNDSSEKPW